MRAALGSVVRVLGRLIAQLWRAGRVGKAAVIVGALLILGFCGSLTSGGQGAAQLTPTAAVTRAAQASTPMPTRVLAVVAATPAVPTAEPTAVPPSAEPTAVPPTETPTALVK